MNLLFYLFMVGVGFLGTLHEMMFGKTNRWLLFVTVLAFVVTACSRIGYSPDGDDLYVYIKYFQGNDESYFEPGYLYSTRLVRFLFSDAAPVLVSFVTLWVVFFVILAAWICERLEFLSSFDVFDYCYPCTMLFIVMLYWGCYFACETLRIGMAIGLLYSSLALAVNGKFLLSLIPMALAPLFHLSAGIFIIGLAAIFIIRQLTCRQYLIWLAVTVVIDIAMELSSSFSLFGVNEFYQAVSQIDALVRVSYYETTEQPEHYFSTQYVTYHIFALLMLLGNLNDRRYNRSVMVYYMGLTVGTVFQSLIIFGRMQAIFLSMVVFPLYYFLKDSSYTLKLKASLVSAYTLIQGIMIIRLLGWHI